MTILSHNDAANAPIATLKHLATATTDVDPNASPASIANMIPPSPLSSAYHTPQTLLAKFIDSYKELAQYQYVLDLQVPFRQTDKFSCLRTGSPITIDGHSLSIPAVTAAARFGAAVELTGGDATRELVKKSRAVIDDKISSGTSIYGVSTGFGGSGMFFSSSRANCDVPNGYMRVRSGYSYLGRPGSGQRAFATPAHRRSPIFNHRSPPCTSPPRPSHILQHARILGSRCYPHPHELPHPRPLRRQVGAHREDGRAPQSERDPLGASQRQHLCFRRSVLLVLTNDVILIVCASN